MPEIDVSNICLIAMGTRDKIVSINPMPLIQGLTHDQALVLAAYIVSMVDDDQRWQEVLQAVQSV